MDAEAVKTLINQTLTEAVQDGGLLAKPIEDIAKAHAAAVVKAETGVGGELDTFVTKALQTFTGNPTFENSVTKLITDFDPLAAVKAEYPFVRHLATLDPPKYRAAWKALLTDPDNTESILDSFQDSAVANIMALAAAHPAVADVQRLKAAATLRNAPKVTFKQLCLPAKGGGPEKLQVYMASKSEDANPDVKALARSVTQLYMLIEKRYTSLQTIKKGGPTKADAQRQEMMEFVYHSIKAYKLRTCKSTASAPVDHAFLHLVHGQDLSTALSKMLGKRSFSERAQQSSGLASSGQLQPRPADPLGLFSQSSHAQQSSLGPGKGGAQFQSAKGGGAAKGGTGAKAASTAQAASLMEQLAAMVQANKGDTEGFTKFLDDQYKKHVSGDARTAYQKFLREFCKNCLMAGRGIEKHGARKCRELGNPCVLPCVRCALAGNSGQVHWLEDCPA